VTRHTFFDVVQIEDTPQTARSGIAGRSGIVLGISEGEVIQYAVSVDHVTYMVDEDHLQSTGRSVPPDEIYPGDSARVDLDGNLLEYKPGPAGADDPPTQ
jgi:hypothetical protein